MKEMKRKIQAAIAAETLKQVRAFLSNGCDLAVSLENTILEGWRLPLDYEPGDKPGEWLGDAVVEWDDGDDEYSLYNLYFRENGDVLVEEEWVSTNTNVLYYLVPAAYVRHWFNVRISCCA